MSELVQEGLLLERERLLIDQALRVHLPQLVKVGLAARVATVLAPSAVVYVWYALSCVPYHWLAATIAALRGIEPYAVMQVLAARLRRPAPAVGEGPQVLGIYARTSGGRPRVVTVRRGDGFDRWILGARDMTNDELAAFEAWEATR